MGGDDQFNKQHIDFTIAPAGYDITNPFRDMKVVITQNNRWDNAVTNIRPTFINGSQFVFSLDDASTFNGGNEFRYFDVRSLRFLTEFARQPDDFLGFLALGLSMGQWLSLPMIAFGIGLWLWAARRPAPAARAAG